MSPLYFAAVVLWIDAFIQGTASVLAFYQDKKLVAVFNALAVCGAVWLGFAVWSAASVACGDL